MAASIASEANASLCTRTELMMLEGQNTTRAVASRVVQRWMPTHAASKDVRHAAVLGDPPDVLEVRPR